MIKCSIFIFKRAFSLSHSALIVIAYSDGLNGFQNSIKNLANSYEKNPKTKIDKLTNQAWKYWKIVIKKWKIKYYCIKNLNEYKIIVICMLKQYMILKKSKKWKNIEIMWW